MHRHYADVIRWSKEGGFCDWLIPQAYVGFEHETLPFEQTCQKWNDLVKSPDVRLVFGLSIYKCGQEDKYAGTGSAEWIRNRDILSRQILFLRNLNHYNGLSLFSYSYAFGKNINNISLSELLLLNSML